MDPLSALLASPDPSDVGDKPWMKADNKASSSANETTNNAEESSMTEFSSLKRSNSSGDRPASKRSRKEMEEEGREKMQVLVSNFTEEQLDRYEMFRRSAFPKAAVKRVMQTITGCSVSQNVVIAMSGVAKVFIGELVEEALDVMEKSGESGPLQPKHIREAVRRFRLDSSMTLPTLKKHRATFTVE